MFAAIVFVLVAAFVTVLTWSVTNVLARAYSQYRERYSIRTMSDLSETVMFIEPRQLLVLNLSSMILFGIFVYLLVNVLIAVLAAVVGFLLPMVVVRQLRLRRVRTFNGQLVNALQAMSGAFKAGLTFPQAAEHVAKESPAPLSQEFSLLVKELKLGVSLEQALLNLSARVGSEDLDLLVVSTNIARQLGGNMAEMFETIAGTIRERFRLEGRIDALTAQGRLQGWVVSLMPLAIAVIFNWLWPDMMQPMMKHVFGWVLVGVNVLMELLGFFLIRRIVNINV